MDKLLASSRTPANLFCKSLIDQGVTDARTLMKRSGAPKTTVYRLLAESKDPKKEPKKKGRKFALSKEDQQDLRLTAYKHRLMSNSQLAKKLEEKERPTVSRWTIGRYLNDMGIKRRVARRVPLLTEGHRKKRLQWGVFPIRPKQVALSHFAKYSFGQR